MPVLILDLRRIAFVSQSLERESSSRINYAQNHVNKKPTAGDTLQIRRSIDFAKSRTGLCLLRFLQVLDSRSRLVSDFQFGG